MEDDKKKSNLPKANKALVESLLNKTSPYGSTLQKVIKSMKGYDSTLVAKAFASPYESTLQKVIKSMEGYDSTLVTKAFTSPYESTLQKVIKSMEGYDSTLVTKAFTSPYESTLQKVIKSMEGYDSTLVAKAFASPYESTLQKVIKSMEGYDSTLVTKAFTSPYESTLQKVIKSMEGYDSTLVTKAFTSPYESTLQKVIKSMEGYDSTLVAKAFASPYESTLQKVIKSMEGYDSTLVTKAFASPFLKIPKSLHSYGHMKDSNFVSIPHLSLQATRLNNSVSSIIDKLYTTVYEEKSEPDLVTKFQEISKKIENHLETSEIPVEFVDDIIGIKESIDSMEDSDIKNELNLISRRFKVIESNNSEEAINPSSESVTSYVIISKLSAQIEELTEKINSINTFIQNNPDNPEKSLLEEIKSRLTLGVIIVTIVLGILSGISKGIGSDIYANTTLSELIPHKEQPTKKNNIEEMESLNKLWEQIEPLTLQLENFETPQDRLSLSNSVKDILNNYDDQELVEKIYSASQKLDEIMKTTDLEDSVPLEEFLEKLIDTEEKTLKFSKAFLLEINKENPNEPLVMKIIEKIYFEKILLFIIKAFAVGLLGAYGGSFFNYKIKPKLFAKDIEKEKKVEK